MSGGHWGYKSFELESDADKWATFMRAVARTEHIVDWAICCDTRREDAERELFDLWERTFDEVYDS